MHRPPILIGALVIVMAMQVMMILNGATPILTGRLIDADAYMRLERARDLWLRGDWFDLRTLSTNAPFGEIINWSRPFDAILFAGGWIGHFFTNFDTALWNWGVVVSPVLLVLTVLALSWGLRPLLSGPGFLLAMVVAALQPQITWIYLFGRSDHHSLMGLLFALDLAMLVRLALGLGGTRMALAAGFVGALALWVSVESLVAQLFFPLALIVLWIWRREDFLARIVGYLWGLALGLALTLLVERGIGGFLTVVYARFSIVHLLLATTSALAWTAMLRHDLRRPLATPARRLAAAAGAAALAGVVMLAVFPKFFGGPEVDIDPGVFVWQRDNGEYAMLVPLTPQAASKFFFHLLPGLIGAGYALWRLRRRADDDLAKVLVAILVGQAVFLAPGLYQIRWTSYFQFLALIPFTLALLELLDRAGRQPLLLVRSAASATVLVVGIGAHMIFGALLDPAKAYDPRRDPSSPQCADFAAISRFLAENHRGPADVDALMSYYYRGPELVWRTPYAVVGAPYMVIESLRDNADFFATTSADEARAIAVRRGISRVLTCSCCNDANEFPDPQSFHRRLQEGEPPEWLRPISLPPSLDRAFQVYEVR